MSQNIEEEGINIVDKMIVLLTDAPANSEEECLRPNLNQTQSGQRQ